MISHIALTRSQRRIFRAFCVLWNNGERSISYRDLQEHTGCSYSTVYKAVRFFERQGIVTSSLQPGHTKEYAIC